MKLVIAGLVIAVAATSPVLAAGKSKKARAHPHVRPEAARTHVMAVPGRGRSAHPQWDVYRMNGEYAGTDPDPHVRAMLFRDDPNADP